MRMIVSVFAFIIDGGDCTFLFEGMDRFKAIGCDAKLADGRLLVHLDESTIMEVSRIDEYHYKIIVRDGEEYEEYVLATDVEPTTLIDEDGGSTGLLEWAISGKTFKVLVY